MQQTVCDICKKTIIEKDEFVFFIKGQKFRFAILQIKRSNGIRWKEADICFNCIKKHIHKLIIQKIPRPKLCSNCIHNQHRATRYCKMGILKERRTLVCKYKEISKKEQSQTTKDLRLSN